MSSEKQNKMEEKWIIPRKRHVPCVWPVHTYWAWPVHEYFGVPTTGKVISVWENGDYTVVFDKQKTSIELGNAITDRILTKEAKDLKGFRATGIKAGEDAVAFCKVFAEKPEESSIADYIRFFNEFTDKYVAIMRDNMHYWVMASPIIEKLIKKDLSSYDSQVIDEIFQIMAAPTEISYSNKVDSELKKITDKAREQGIESVQDDIKEFSNNYFWFPYEYVGPGIWDQKTVISLVEKGIQESKTGHSSASGDSSAQEGCVQKYSLSERITELFKILQTLTLMSDDRKRYNSEICYYLNGVILNNLAKKLGISREDALYIDHEFLATYEENPTLFKQRLSQRLEMLVEVTEDSVYSWYEGKEDCGRYLESLDIYLKVDSNIREVKGQIAFKGKVVGKARVLKTSHVTDFTEGDIIVTGMTTPDFVPLMKKALAVVTNEGGITCHAAIVSRELKIPCVIGTKIATQVFKDGDMIEVDANTGIVKLI